jgi:hypothetical protein
MVTRVVSCPLPLALLNPASNTVAPLVEFLSVHAVKTWFNFAFAIDFPAAAEKSRQAEWSGLKP